MPAGGQPARRRRRRPTGRAAAARSQPSNAAAAGTPPQLCRALSEAAKACKFAGWTWSRLGQTRTETRTEGPATAQALRSRGGLRRLSESSYPSHLVRVILSESSCPSLLVRVFLSAVSAPRDPPPNKSPKFTQPDEHVPPSFHGASPRAYTILRGPLPSLMLPGLLFPSHAGHGPVTPPLPSHGARRDFIPCWRR